MTSGAIRELLDGELEGPDDLVVTGLATVVEAASTDAVLVHTKAYGVSLASSLTRVAVVTRGIALPDGVQESANGPRALIMVPDAEVASIALFTAFAHPPVLPSIGIHASAVVDSGARVDASTRVGPLVHIGERATVAASCVIHAGACVGAGASIGHGTTLGARCIIGDRVIVGNSCVIGPGAVIGEEGFGYRPLAGRGLTRIPHIGTVVLEDAVEIGANTTIDRAKTGATRIGQGTKIDNLCQIGHNVVIGKHCAISGLTGIAGSCTVGDGVMMGGGVGIADHLTIGAGAQIGGKSGIMRDVPPRARVAGTPAQDVRDFLRQASILKTLGDHAPQIQRLLKSLDGESASAIAGSAVP
ncbi:MAG: UDP-3-O-(3-hydroxymyristoyl)glucosamine N-acyltransferase [Planctomycetota bacterium]|nr:UDP-3-O-(3-hydroxymyristoyl)glucosamine N-acyltransferase [Planctomycetota bacterium]